ncbi:MAG: hypothetical protein ACLSHC_00010 [Bilophila wadsworthia]
MRRAKSPRTSPVSARRRKSCSAIFPSCGALRQRGGRFSTGAVGVYSYLNRIAYGRCPCAALNGKFDVKHRAARRLPAHPRCQGTA